MHRFDICRKNVRFEDDLSHELIYYITVDYASDEHSQIVSENYGLGVSITGGDEENIRGITFDSVKIGRLADIIASGTVTPVCLRDVLSDIMDDII